MAPFLLFVHPIRWYMELAEERGISISLGLCCHASFDRDLILQEGSLEHMASRTGCGIVNSCGDYRIPRGV